MRFDLIKHYSKNQTQRTCPDCGEPNEEEHPNVQPCRCPTHLYIPPGKHIHVDCPRHGKVTIRGGPAISC
jgi:hypothetical protein